MVLEPSHKRSSVNRKNGEFLFFSLFFIFIITFTIVIYYFIDIFNSPLDELEVVPEDDIEIIDQEIIIKEIDFQPIVDEWVNSVSGNKSILIDDVKLDKIVGEYNVDEKYNTASLYKLFVVYEGYRRIENGTWSPNDKAGWTGKTILECLDLSIRESYSPCAETLWSMIGHAELDDIIYNDFDITNSNISLLSSNAVDILKIMKLFYHHQEMSDEDFIARMKDSFLNQPATTYNWRQGFPSGFEKANVYDKVGWDYNPNIKNWNIYHDTAIVNFPEENRDYIVVVMTNYIQFEKIREFGSMFENYFYENINN